MNIYTPNKDPDTSFIAVSMIVLVGILGGVFYHSYVLAFALLFWVQYTVTLSYLQFKRKSKHKFKGITESLLVPQFRFFLFELIAFMGLIALIRFNSIVFGISALIIWWAFALNFFLYYSKNPHAK